MLIFADAPLRVQSPRVPFDQLPRDLRADNRLKDGDVRLAATLIGYARNKPHCWPSNARLANDLGVTPRTIQNRLRRLEAAGWVQCVVDTTNRTGRLIILVWRSKPGSEPAKRVSSPPVKAVSPEVDRSVKEKETSPKRHDEPARQMPPDAARATPVGPTALFPARAAQAPPAAPEPPKTAPSAAPRRRPSLTTAELTELVAKTNDPILAAELAKRTAPKPEPKPAPTSTTEMIRRLRECPTYLPILTRMLAVEFDDERSWSGLHAVVGRAWRGEIDLDDLADAYRQATGPDVRNRGAMFMYIIKRIRISNNTDDKT